MRRQPGAHVCVPSSTRAEQLATAASWLREGLAHSEQCVYLAEHPEDPELRAALDSAATANGIAILGAEDVALGSPFVPSRMLEWLGALVDAAMRDGHNGVRVCQEVTATDHGIEFECRLDELVQERPLGSMCLYDRSRLPASVVHDSLATHPLVWVRDVVCANPRYVPPQHVLAHDRGEREIAGILEQLYVDETERQRRFSWLRRKLAQMETERRALARTLHDELGQTLVVLAFDGRNEAVDDAIELVRAMARDLRPPALDDLGLVAAVRALVTREAMRAGLDLTLELAVDDSRLDDEVSTALYRILEAALANVVAHAHARSLSVSLRGEAGAIALTVHDDGIGFGRGVRAGGGLVDIEQRLQLLGGQLEIDSRPGEGTTIRARVPA